VSERERERERVRVGSSDEELLHALLQLLQRLHWNIVLPRLLHLVHAHQVMRDMHSARVNKRARHAHARGPDTHAACGLQDTPVQSMQDGTTRPCKTARHGHARRHDTAMQDGTTRPCKTARHGHARRHDTAMQDGTTRPCNSWPCTRHTNQQGMRDLFGHNGWWEVKR